MAGLGSAPRDRGRRHRPVVVMVADGPGILPEVAARLATTGLRVSGPGLAPPTLDDVFLTLTGKPTPGASDNRHDQREAAMSAMGHIPRRSDWRTRAGWLLANVATVTGRNLHRLVRVPTLIAFATVQPVLFVLLFTYAWGGAVHPPGVGATSTTRCPASGCSRSRSAPPRPESPSPTTWPPA